LTGHYVFRDCDRKELELTEPSDRQLVEAALDGRPEAYGRLYDRYAPLIRSACYDTTRDLSEAQDLAQDVFIRAYERLRGLRDPDKFDRWLISMARFRCREWYRSRQRLASRMSSEVPDDGAHPEASIKDEMEVLRLAITELPENERMAIHAFYLQQQDTEQVRRMLGLSRSGLYRVLERARQRLRRRLSGQGGTHESGLRAES
jgi:RNA polymerase sigma-70 factor (ECF subfamily)